LETYYVSRPCARLFGGRRCAGVERLEEESAIVINKAMMTFFRLGKTSGSRCYALVSGACPFIAAGLSGLISYSYSGYWKGLDISDDANRHAGALMAAVEGILTIACMAAVFLIGSILSFVSLSWQRSRLGFTGLALNSIPFLLFFFVLAKGFFFGF
jgi:hypothetical protein